MKILLSEEEIKKAEGRLSLVLNGGGIEYNNIKISWDEINIIQKLATRKVMPIHKRILANITP